MRVCASERLWALGHTSTRTRLSLLLDLWAGSFPSATGSGEAKNAPLRPSTPPGRGRAPASATARPARTGSEGNQLSCQMWTW